jgi:hypothetical protein
MQANDRQVRLLAVGTSVRTVRIYSLPYRKKGEPAVLSKLTCVICDLKRSESPSLLQATRLTWLVGQETLLAAGYSNGIVAVWNASTLSDRENLPRHVMQPHSETITALDFKSTTSGEIHLLTASLDRKVKFFMFDGCQWQEISSFYANSRVLCAEWWLHWPGFLFGIDNSFNYGSIFHRQPLEFGSRNTLLLCFNSSVVHLDINHWINFAMFVTDTGDVLGCQPGQMELLTSSKTVWKCNNFRMISSNHLVEVTAKEKGIVFSEFQVSWKKIISPLVLDICFVSLSIDRIKSKSPKNCVKQHQIKSTTFSSIKFASTETRTVFVSMRWRLSRASFKSSD